MMQMLQSMAKTKKMHLPSTHLLLNLITVQKRMVIGGTTKGVTDAGLY